MGESFASWALDPKRSVEERYAVERLIWIAHPKLFENPDWSWNQNYEAKHLRQKARALNPAYLPQYSAA